MRMRAIVLAKLSMCHKLITNLYAEVSVLQFQSAYRHVNFVLYIHDPILVLKCRAQNRIPLVVRSAIGRFLGTQFRCIIQSRSHDAPYS